jgi:hypothetical protein
MQSDPSPNETSSPSTADLTVRALLLEGAREAYVGRRCDGCGEYGCANDCDPDARYELTCADETA